MLALPRVDEAFLQGFSEGLLALADRASHRAGRRRHDRRAADHRHHRVRRGAARPGVAARRRAGRRRPVGQPRTGRRHRRRAAGARGLSRPGVRCTARCVRPGCAARWSGRSRAWRWAWRCAASRMRAIDFSDGLCGDLGHVLARSRVGAELDVDCAAALACAGRAAAWRCSSAACSAAATTTSCCSARRRRARTAVQRAAAARRGRRDAASAACKPRRGLRVRMPDGRSRRGRRAASITSRGRIRMSTLPLPPVAGYAPRRARRRFLCRAPGALGGAGLRQRPGAEGRRHRGHAVGLGHVHRARPLARATGNGPCCSLLSFALGWWACTRCAQALRQADPGAIVWDEVLAFWIVLWLVMPAELLGPVGVVRACFACSTPPSRGRWAGPTACSRRTPATRSAPAGLRHPVR